MSLIPPAWAWTRMRALTNVELATNAVQVAFARYIAANEEPPVDPLLIEARKIARPFIDALDADILDGGHDSSSQLCVAYAALVRGIELAKQGTL